ncbi:MAG: signal peptidase II [Acidimicrobiia bacterium]
MTSSSGAARLRILSLVAAALWLALDQLTKHWALNSLATRTVHVLWMRFYLAFNSGMAFSRGRGMGPIIGVVALVVVVVLVVGMRRPPSRLAALATGLVIGGALGNVVDRLFRAGTAGFLRGRVIDFIELARFWPVFNIADVGIVVGGIVLVLTAVRQPPADQAAPIADPPASAPGDDA